VAEDQKAEPELQGVRSPIIPIDLEELRKTHPDALPELSFGTSRAEGEGDAGQEAGKGD
jgi:hypothetical protein